MLESQLRGLADEGRLRHWDGQILRRDGRCGNATTPERDHRRVYMMVAEMALRGSAL